MTKGDTQWLQTTGRLENGALFNVVARTVNTGQRAVFALNTGIDESWAVGSNDNGNSTGGNAIPQHSVGPSLRFDGKTAGSEADATIGASRLAIGALSVPEAKTGSNGAIVRVLDINFNALTDINPSDDNLDTYVRPTYDSIVSDGTSDPNTSGAARYEAVLISHYNTVKAPSPSALLAQEHADGILVGDNNTAHATDTGFVSATVQQTEWGKVNSFNQNNLSDPTASGIKGDVQYASGPTVVGGDVAAFISNIANSNAVIGGSVGTVTNNANNPADGLLSIGFLPPTLLDWTRVTDGGTISPNIATGNAKTQQDNARTNYGTLFTPDGTSGANANTATSGLLYGGNGTNGNGLAINGNVLITTKNANGSNASNGTITTAGNYLFGNFNQNGVRDYAAVKESVNAALSLFAIDGAKNSIFTNDGGQPNNTAIPSLVGSPGWATITVNGGLANTKGDLIVLGDFNGDGKFDGQDIYFLAIGASLAQGTRSVTTDPGSNATLTASETLTPANTTAANFSDDVRNTNAVLRKNDALDYITGYLSSSATTAGANFLKTTGHAILTVPGITALSGPNSPSTLSATATAVGVDPISGLEQFTFDPNGNYTFDKHDVNRDGVVDFNDAILVDKFAGQTYGYAQTNSLSTPAAFETALTNTLAATQQTPVSGAIEAASLVSIQQIDGEAAIGSADLAELNIGLATNGPTNWYAYTLAKTGTGTINFAKTAGTVTVFAASTGTGPATYQINGGTVNVGKAILDGSSQPAQAGILTTIAGAIDPFSDSSATGLDTTKSLAITVTGTTTTLDYAARTGTVGDTGIKTYRLNSLTAQNGATVKFDSAYPSANHSVLITSGLNILDTSKVDIGANDLIVRNGSLSTINTQLKAGFNAHGGYWNGTGGIVSLAAAGDTRYLTTLGYRQSDGTSFDGQTPATTDVLVKYTYYGDSNLDGIVNGADYQQIDAGFGSGATNWSHGDFNYDGVINGSDFALIDNTFNQIAATNAGALALIASSSIPLESSALIASPTAGVASVPEPASLGLLAISSFGLLNKRRRSA